MGGRHGDAETSLTIAGGTSWAHWLAGTAVEAKRWLDEAFACTGEVSDGTRAMALIGPGLDRLPARHRRGCRRRLRSSARRVPSHSDPAPLAYTNSFYAEVAAARGDIDKARRRRREALAFYESLPDDPFVIAARAYSMAKLARPRRRPGRRRALVPGRSGRVRPSRSADDAGDVPRAWSPTSTNAPATTTPRSGRWSRRSSSTTRSACTGSTACCSPASAGRSCT